MFTSTSAYLFIGGNSSFHDNTTSPTARFAINLDDLPATYVEQGVGITAGIIRLVGPLSSVLLCDPQPKISVGRVRLENDGTVNVISSGQPPSGNFPSTSVNFIFSNAFQDALSELETSEDENFVNTIAADMFMTNSFVDRNSEEGIAPMEIPSINRNMDDFMSSAAKAFIDGYRESSTGVDPTFDLVFVPGLGEEQKLALTTSRKLFITTIVLDVIITALLCTLIRSAPTWKGIPFNFMNVLQLLSEGCTKER